MQSAAVEAPLSINRRRSLYGERVLFPCVHNAGLDVILLIALTETCADVRHNCLIWTPELQPYVLVDVSTNVAHHVDCKYLISWVVPKFGHCSSFLKVARPDGVFSILDRMKLSNSATVLNVTSVWLEPLKTVYSVNDGHAVEPCNERHLEAGAGVT
jgi:hypothetical protein